MPKDLRICGARDRALRALRDVHRPEYDELYREAQAADRGDGQAAVWRSRRLAFRTLRDRHRGQYDELYRLEMGYTAQECAVCGAEFFNRGAVNCDAEFCRRAYGLLRYLTQPGYRDRNRRAAARRLEHDSNAGRRHWAQRVLAGAELRPHGDGRWLIDGAEAKEFAIECIRRDYPIVEKFPDVVRARLVCELAALDSAMPGTMKLRV